MSAERLREMLSEATPGPWKVAEDGDGKTGVFSGNEGASRYADLAISEFFYGTLSDADVRLIALSPDAIALLVDMGEAAHRANLETPCSCGKQGDYCWNERLLACVRRLDALCGDER